MARSEARLSVDIWNDRHFLTLTPMAQRLYMFLLSQADLTHIGTIALRERRWSNGAAGLTVADIERDLKELEAGDYLIVDWDLEEVLIRTFIRGDKVYRQPQVLAVAAEVLTLVTSLPLRVALRVELEKITELEMAAASRDLIGKMLASLSDTTEAAISETTGGEGGRHPTRHPAPHPLGVRGVSTVVTTDSPNPLDPDPQSPNPKAPMSADALIPRAALAEPAPKTLTKRAIAEAFARLWDVYPRKVSRGVAEKAFTQAVKDTDPEVIISGAVAYRDHGPRVRSELKFTKHPATWLNGKCWLDDLAADTGPPRTNGHQPYRNPEDPSIYEGTL